MEFENPWFFSLLLVLPVLWYLDYRRAGGTIRFSDTRFLAGLITMRVQTYRFLAPLLRTLAVGCMIFAVTGPRTPDRKTRLPTSSIAVVIVLDMSGSMFAPTFPWSSEEQITRNDAAKRAFRLLVAGGEGPSGIKFEGRSTERGTDAIGLVTFTNWPYPICPPTLNHSVLLHLLEDSRRPALRDEGSNVGDAIMEGLIRLERASSPRKVLILLSDGEHNFDPDFGPKRKVRHPEEAASFAANLGIPIYSIDTGGDPDPSKPKEVDQRTKGREINQAIADIAGGQSFTANDGGQLLAVCQAIDRFERQPLLSHSYRRWHEWYPWFAGAGLLLLVLVFSLEQTVWRKLP